MNPFTLFVVVAFGVAAGIYASQYFMVMVYIIGGALSVLISLITIPWIWSKLKLSDIIAEYLLAFPRSISMIFGKPDHGSKFSLKRRIAGLFVMLTWIAWALFLIGIGVILFY